jgi:hypothetical protein
MTDLEKQNITLNTEELLDEDHISVWYFPSNVYYKKLGMEFIIEKHKLLPDPNMIGLYEKLSENILDPAEAFELKKKEIDIKSE